MPRGVRAALRVSAGDLIDWEVGAYGANRVTPKNRPALVLLGASSFNTPAGYSVMAMITSQGNSPWPLDCPLTNIATAGLPAASMVRFKLFNFDHRLVRGELGKLANEPAAAVRSGLHQLLGGMP
jgi:mRNA interferase MazF